MLIARAGELLATVARHAVPLNGLFGRDWHPVTFGFFAGLKVLFEVWGRLARFFGWQSLKDREAAATARTL